MQIGAIFSNSNNPYLKNAAYATNYRSAAKQAEQLKSGESARTDTATFSIKPQRTQANQFLQGLMEQKQSLQEQKQKLMETSKENGGSNSTLKEQLDALNKQIEEINEQITQQMVSSATSDKQNDKDKTPALGGNQPDGLDSLLTASNSLENAKIISKAQGQTERQTRVLESEIKLDKNIAYKPDIILATSKEKPLELTELKEKAVQLQKTVGEQVANAESNIQDNAEATEALPQKLENDEESQISK